MKSSDKSEEEWKESSSSVKTSYSPRGDSFGGRQDRIRSREAAFAKEQRKQRRQQQLAGSEAKQDKNKQEYTEIEVLKKAIAENDLETALGVMCRLVPEYGPVEQTQLLQDGLMLTQSVSSKLLN